MPTAAAIREGVEVIPRSAGFLSVGRDAEFLRLAAAGAKASAA
jgi:hypothetical protein